MSIIRKRMEIFTPCQNANKLKKEFFLAMVSGSIGINFTEKTVLNRIVRNRGTAKKRTLNNSIHVRSH